MAVKLSQCAFKHAQSLVRRKKFVADERDAWSEHQPSAQDENEFIRALGNHSKRFSRTLQGG